MACLRGMSRWNGEEATLANCISFAFVEFSSPKEAAAVVKQLDRTPLDKKHTMLINKLTDIERYGREGRIDEAIPARVGLSRATVEEMYRIMALAAYEDRYVIPTAHRELEEDAYALRGSTGFGFREATTGATKVNLFGGTKRTPRRSPNMDVPT